MFCPYNYIGAVITGMGTVESGVADNSWLPPDDDPPNVTFPYLPPISGAGKVGTGATVACSIEHSV